MTKLNIECRLNTKKVSDLPPCIREFAAEIHSTFAGNCGDCRHQLGESDTAGHQEGQAPRLIGKAMRLQPQAQEIPL